MKIEKYEQIMSRLAALITGTRFETHVFSVVGCVWDKHFNIENKDNK